MKKNSIINRSALAKRLFELRTKSNLTQRDLADKLKMTYQSYQAYELGKTLPTLQNFVKLADVFNVSLEYLLNRK